MAEVQTRHPVDTEATRALIAKIKKGDQDNADAIGDLAQQVETVNGRGLMVVNGQLRFG